MEKFEVNENTCIRCGMCTGIAPEIFEFNESGDSIVVNNEKINEENLNDAISAKDNCPVSAISNIKE